MKARSALTLVLLLLLVACERSAPPELPPAPAPDAAAAADAPPEPADAPATTTRPDGDVAGLAGPAGADDEPFSLWPAVQRGTLPNGLTWYVIQHARPEKRALLWLVVNAGSILEDDDQRGVAHFVEHMAFNGTTHFPKSAIVDYLQSIGMQFGPHVNAYTSYDETVYQLVVPSDDPGYLGKGLDVLREWAGEVSFDPGEVDKERGVVLEEWRLGLGAGQRLADKQQPVLFAGSRYAERLPIGRPEVIQGASRDVLLRFYRDWYRPELLAVIAVGDFDPAWMRGEIERRFGGLAAPPSARPRTRAEVPRAGGTRVSIESDRELPAASVALFDLVPHRPESTPRHLRRGVLEQLWVAILDERFDILRRRPDAPFSGASVGIASLTREIDGLVRAAAVKGDRIEDALRSLVTEVLRVERHGVTAGELERARKNLARVYEEYAASEGTADSSQYAAEATRNFLEGELMIGPRAESAAARRFLPGITLAELNALAKGFAAADNRAIEIAAREGQPLPTKERVLAMVAEVEASDIPPWEEAAAAPALMPVAPVAGRIVAERTIDAVGVSEWTLSNGARVVVKPTDFSADSFELFGESPGGLAAVSDADFPSARFAEEALAVGGLGELDATALAQALAGKSASAATTLGDTREGVAGGGSPKDLETTLQLVWLRFTAPRRDDQAIAVWRNNVAEALTNARRAPAARFALELDDLFHQGHPRKRAPTAADVEAFAADKALAIHRERFGDASDFTFVIVGAVDLAALRPLVETYLASLPGAGRKEREADVGVRLPRGKLAKTWHLGQEPRASVRLAYYGEERWTRDRERDMHLLGEVLGLRLEAVLREELSGVYDVSARGFVTRGPREERVLWIGFGCAPDNVAKLVAATRGVIADIIAKGPREDELEKVRRSFVRTREVQLRQNGFWIGWLAAAYRYGEDPALILDPSQLVLRATVPNVRAAAKRNLDARRSLEAVLLPAEP